MYICYMFLSLSGENDAVRCFHCDGGIIEWDQNDDPLREHLKWFPDCKYIQEVNTFIN